MRHDNAAVCGVGHNEDMLRLIALSACLVAPQQDIVPKAAVPLITVT
jgi:hypothetical protein